MFECYEDVQGEKALTHMPGTMGKAKIDKIHVFQKEKLSATFSLSIPVQVYYLILVIKSIHVSNHKRHYNLHLKHVFLTRTTKY